MAIGSNVKKDKVIKKTDETVKEAVEQKTTTAGLQEGWTRSTFILREDFLEKLKGLAFYENKSIKDILDEVLDNFLKDKDIPVKRKSK
jgi:hypothetical protein